MPEYIEREKAEDIFAQEMHEILKFNQYYQLDKEEKDEYNRLEDYQKRIASLPTADVEEVVRCKDCGSYNKRYGECTRNGSHLGENGFCSYGAKNG